MRKYTRARWFVAIPLATVSSLGLVAANRPAATLSGCNV